MTEYAALGLLDEVEERSGYDLLKRAERGVGYMWAPAKSGLYTVLRRLERAGLVEGRSAQDRGPGKRLFRRTRAGSEALRAWAADPGLDLAPPREPFLLKLHFSRRLAPEAAVEQVQRYRAHVAALLAEWERLEGEPADELGRITLRYALVRARAALAWCDETLETLRRSPS